MRGMMDVRVFCPYEADCPVKARQMKQSVRTELCILDHHPEDCRLIREGGKYESVYQRTNDRLQKPE